MFHATITAVDKENQNEPDYSTSANTLNEVKTFVKYNLPGFDLTKLAVGKKMTYAKTWILRVSEQDSDLPEEDLPEDDTEVPTSDTNLADNPVVNTTKSSVVTGKTNV